MTVYIADPVEVNPEEDEDQSVDSALPASAIGLCDLAGSSKLSSISKFKTYVDKRHNKWSKVMISTWKESTITIPLNGTYKTLLLNASPLDGADFDFRIEVTGEKKE